MADERCVFRITGSARESFLQGLVTSDVRRLDQGCVYTALLTPQGKYFADFFLVPWDDAILLDVAASLAEPLLKKLSMYKLRADVQIDQADLVVSQGTGTAPEGAFQDPRSPDLGWRAYGPTATSTLSDEDWQALRVGAGVPEAGIELIPDSTLILEAGFARLNGVDFRKGCFIGQEVTARMRHKTELRKGLARVGIDGAAPIGTAITSDDGKPAGTLYTQAEGVALAHLRFDRATGPMQAGDATITMIEPAI